jgi:tight adherence protein B
MTAFAASLFLFLAITSAALVLFRPSRQRALASARLRELTEQDEPGKLASSVAGADLRRTRSSIPTLRRLLTGTSWATDLEVRLRRADLNLRVGEFVLLRALVAMVLFFLTVAISRFQPIGFFIGILVGAVGLWLPSVYVNLLIQRRRNKLERQLVDLVPMLSSSLRGGFAFQQAMDVASRQIGPPMSDELSMVIHDVNLGSTMQAALQDLGSRVDSTDLDMLITAILVQRTTGGNIAEVLDKTAETMSERERIRGEVRTLTAQQRLTGLILSVYPLAIGLLLLAIMPSLWSKLFTETAGQVMLGIALVLQVIGFIAIRRALRVDI